MTWLYSGDVNALYQPVVRFLLNDDISFFFALRQQFNRSKVISIEENGYGFYVDFEVCPEMRILNAELRNRMIGGVAGINRAGECVCAFTLLVVDGLISSLEGNPTAADTWPEEEIELKYMNQREDGNEYYFSDARNQCARDKYLSSGKVLVEGSFEKGASLSDKT